MRRPRPGRSTNRSTRRSTGNGGARPAALLRLLSRSEVPTVATDLDGHVLWLNHEAEELFAGRDGRSAGRSCFDLVGGLDAFGNRFCHENCSLVAMSRRGEAIRGFEMVVEGSSRREQPFNVTILKVPVPGTGGLALVHLFHPIDRQTQLALGLERLGNDRARTAEAAPVRPPRAARPPLTPRQIEILEWMAVGLQNKEIAERLGIALATVRNHVHNVLQELEVHSKLEAVALAFFRGWVTPAHGEGVVPASDRTGGLDGP